jgi:hypothetical protein
MSNDTTNSRVTCPTCNGTTWVETTTIEACPNRRCVNGTVPEFNEPVEFEALPEQSWVTYGGATR